MEYSRYPASIEFVGLCAEIIAPRTPCKLKDLNYQGDKEARKISYPLTDNLGLLGSSRSAVIAFGDEWRQSKKVVVPLRN